MLCKSDQNRSWDALRMPRHLQERPERILGTSRECLGIVLGSPRCAPRAPRESTKALRNARESAQERPGARRSDQNRFQGTSGSERIDYFPCSMIEKRFRLEFSSIFVDFGLSQKDGEPSEVLRLPAKTEVRLFALRIDSLARRNLEKRRKSTHRTSQNRRKRRLGANRRSFRSISASRAAWASGPGGPGEQPRRPRQPRRLVCAFRLARSAATSGPARARSPSRFQSRRHRWATSL